MATEDSRSPTHPDPRAGRHAERMSSATPERDRAVDVARLGALVVVMFGHCALLLATVDSGGLRVGNILGEMPVLTPLTWLAQVMPLFFLAGGAAGAYGWHAGTPWGTWLLSRAQRLCRPVFWYLAFWTAGLLVTRMVLGAESADRLGRESVALLWFLGVYLVTLAFVPMLTRLRDVRGLTVVVIGLLVAAGLVDAIRIATDNLYGGVANFVFIWLIPVAIGVGYARRLIRPAAALIVAALALAVQVVLVNVGPYEVSLVVTGTEKLSNVTPPTLLLGLHCVWMSLLFVAAAGAIGRWAERPRVWRVVSVGNGGAMTIYLWHIPAIAVAALSLNAFGLDAWDVHASNFGWMLLLRIAVFSVVMAIAFKVLSPLEHLRLPWWDAKVTATGARSTVAGALVCIAGIALLVMAKFGLAGIEGWSAMGGFVVAMAAARFSAGVSPVVPTSIDREPSTPRA